MYLWTEENGKGGLCRHYTKHPSEAIISYDSAHAYSRTRSPMGPLSNLIVSAPTPLAPIHGGGEASRCRSLLLSPAARAHVDSRSLHYLRMSALARTCSSCKLTSVCTSTSSFHLVKACLTSKKTSIIRHEKQVMEHAGAHLQQDTLQI